LMTLMMITMDDVGQSLPLLTARTSHHHIINESAHARAGR